MRLMLFLLVACNRGDEAVEPRFPDIPTASCGADHDWVDLNETGLVLETDHDRDLSMALGGVQALIDAAGLEVEASHGVEVYLVRYTTQDRGELIEASAIVATPDAAGDYPLLVWTHPTAGFSPECGPTNRGLEGAIFPMLFASLGYAVVAPDYVGMNGWADPSSSDLHPYVVAEPTAVATLDSARALLAMELEARADPSRTVFYGVSEGGYAALVSDHYAAALAPELSPRVVMAIVPATDVTALGERGTGTFSDTTGGIAAAMATMQQWYQTPPLSEVLQPLYAESLQETMSSGCAGFDAGDPEVVEDIYTAEFVDSVQDGTPMEPWGCIWEQTSPVSMPVRGSSEATLVLVTGEEDDLAWTPPVRDAVGLYCDEGREVLYRECEGLGHVEAAVETLPWQIETLSGLLSGALAGDCVLSAPEPCP